MRRRGRGRRASGGGGLRDGGPRRNGLAPVGGFARRPGGGAGTGRGSAVEDGAEGEDDANDGEDGEEGEEDLGGFAHIAARHGRRSLESLLVTVPRVVAGGGVPVTAPDEVSSRAEVWTDSDALFLGWSIVVREHEAWWPSGAASGRSRSS